MPIFIDYVVLLLVNMAAGLFLLGGYLLFGGSEVVVGRRWAAPFAIVGLVALVGGFHMVFTWPLPGAFNLAFGEPTVLLGAFFLGMALCLAMGWDPAPMGLYSLFAGLAAIVTGAGILRFDMTQKPGLTGVGFILSGLVGVALWPCLRFRFLKPMRWVVGLVAVVPAIIWMVTAGMGIGPHLKSFSKWQAPNAQTAPAEK